MLFSIGVFAQDIEYGLSSKTYEIAGIEVEGADNYEDFVLIGFSGLAVGDKVDVPGPQITKAIKRFWKQGLFSNVKIKAKKIEGNKIWLVIELAQRPRISEVKYEGLKKSEREDIEVKAGIRPGSQMTPNIEDHAKTVIKKFLGCIEQTSHNTGLTMVIALSYSSRWEITEAMRTAVRRAQAGELRAEDVNEQLVSSMMTTREMPDPDLLIRTSGEYRISNFLLWQLAYSELYFTDCLWPEFTEEEFYKAIVDYQKRERRFGKTSEQIH